MVAMVASVVDMAEVMEAAMDMNTAVIVMAGKLEKSHRSRVNNLLIIVSRRLDYLINLQVTDSRAPSQVV